MPSKLSKLWIMWWVLPRLAHRARGRVLTKVTDSDSKKLLGFRWIPEEELKDA